MAGWVIAVPCAECGAAVDLGAPVSWEEFEAVEEFLVPPHDYLFGRKHFACPCCTCETPRLACSGEGQPLAQYAAVKIRLPQA